MIIVVFVVNLLFLGCSKAQTTNMPGEDSLQCNGTGRLTFQGDGRFSIVRDGGNGSLHCDGDVNFITNSLLYARVISKGQFICNSSSSVRLCGYGEAELVSSEGSSSMVQCNGEPIFPSTPIPTTFCGGNGDFTVFGLGNYTITAGTIGCTGDFARMRLTLTTYDVAGEFHCSGTGPYSLVGDGVLHYVSSESGNCTATTGEPPTTQPSPTCYGGGNNVSIVGSGYFNLSFVEFASCSGDISMVISALFFQTYGTFYCDSFGNFTIMRTNDGGYLDVSADYHNCFFSTVSPTSTLSTPTPTPIPNFNCYGGGNVSTIEGYGDFNLIFSHYPNCTGNGYFSPPNNNSYYYHTYGNFSCRAFGNFTIERTGYGGSLNVYAEYHNCYLPTMSPTPIPTPTPNFSCYGSGNVSTIEGYGDFNLIFLHYPNCTGYGYSSSYGNNSYYYHSSFGNFNCRAYGNFTIERIGYGGSLNVYAEYHNCYLPTMSPTPIPTPTPNFSCYGSGNVSTIEGYGDFNLIFSHYPNCTGNGYSSSYGNNSYYYHSSYGNFNCRAYGNFTIERIGYGGSLNVYAEYHNCYLPTMSPTPTPIPTPTPNFSCYGNGNDSTIEGYGDFNLIFSHYPNCTGNGYSSSYGNNSYYYHSSYGNFSCRAYGNFRIERIGYGGSLNVYAEYHDCNLPTMSPTPTPTPTSQFSCYGGSNRTISVSGYGYFNLSFTQAANCSGDLFTHNSTYQTFETYGTFYCSASGFSEFSIERLKDGGFINVSADYHNCFLPTISPSSTFSTPTPTPMPNFNCYGGGNVSTIEGYGDFNLIFSHYPNCTGNGYFSPPNNDSYYYHTYGNFSCRAFGNFTIERTGYGGSLNVYAEYHNCYLPTMSPTPIPTPTPNFSCYGSGNVSTIEGYGDFNLIFSHYPNCTGYGYSSSYGNNSYYYHSSFGNFNCRAYGNFTIERIGYGGSLNVYAEYHNCYLPTMSPTPIPTPTPNFSCYGNGNDSTIEGYGDFNLIFSHYPNCTGNGYSSSYGNNSYYYHSSYGNFSCRAYGNFRIERIGYGGYLNVYADYHDCNLPTMSPTPTPTPISRFSCYGGSNRTIIVSGYGYFNLSFTQPANCTGDLFTHNSTYQTFETYGTFYCSASGFSEFSIERLQDGGFLNVSADYHNCFLPTISPSSTFSTPTPTPIPNFSCYGSGNVSTIEGYGDFNLIFSHYPNCTGNGYSSYYNNNRYYYRSYGNFSCRAYGNFTIERIGYGGSLNVYAEYHNCYLPTMSPTPIPTPTPNFSCYGSGNVSTIEGYGDFNLIFSHYPNCTGYGYSSSYGNNSYYYHSSFGNFNCRAYGNFTIERIGYGGSLNVYAEYHNCYLPTMSPTPIPTPTPNFSCYGNGNDSTIEGYGDFNLIFSHYPNCTGNGYSSSYGNNSYYYHSSYGNFSCRAYGNFRIERIGYGGYLNVYADYHDCNLPTMSPTPTPTPISRFSCYGGSNRTIIVSGYGYFNLSFTQPANCTGDLFTHNSTYQTFETYGTFYCSASGFSEFSIERLQDGGFLNVSADYHNCFLPTISPSSTFSTPTPTPIPNFSCYGSGNVSTIEGYGDFNLIFSHYPNCTGNGYSSYYNNNRYYYRSYGNFSCRAYGNFTIERIGYGGSLNVYAEYHNCYLPTMSPTPIPTPTPNFSCYGSGNVSTIEGYGDFNLIFSHYPNCTGYGYSSSYGNNSYYYHSSFGNFNCRAYGNFTIERIGYGGSLNVYAEYHNCYLPTMSPTPIPTPTPNFSCYGNGNDSTIEGYGDFNLIFSHYPNCTGNGYSSSYGNNSYYYHSSYGNFSCIAYGNFTIERIGYGGSLNVYAEYHNCYLPTMSPTPTPIPTPTPNFSCYGSGNVSTIEGYGDFNLIFSHYPNCTGYGYSSSYGNSSYYYHSSYGNFSCIAYGNFTIERIGYGGSLNVYAEYHNCYLPTMSPTPIPTPTPNFSCYGNGNDSTIEGYGDFNLIFSHYPNCTGNGYSSSYGNNSYYYHSSYGNFSCIAYGNFTIERIGYGGSLNVYAEYHNCYLPTMSPTPTPIPTPTPNFSCYGSGNVSTIEGYGDFNLIFSHYPNCTGYGYSSSYGNSSYYYHSSYGNFSCIAYGNFTIERIGYGGSLNVYAEYHNCYLPTMSPTPIPTPTPNFSCYGSGNDSTIEGYGDFNLIFSHYPNCTGNGYSSSYGNNSYFYHSSYGNFSCRAYGNFRIERIGYGGYLNVYADYHDCNLPTMSPTPTPTPISRFSCYGGSNRTIIVSGYGYFNLSFTQPANCTGDLFTHNSTYQTFETYGTFYCSASGFSEFSIERLQDGGFLNVSADYHNCFLPTISPSSTFSTPTPTPIPNFICYGSGNVSTIEGYGDFNLIFSHYPNCTRNGYSSFYNNNRYYYRSYGNFSCRAYGNFTIERIGYGGSLNVYAEYHNCYLPTMSPTPIPTPTPNFSCYGSGNVSTIEGYGDFNLIFSHYPNCTGYGYSSSYGNNSYYYRSSYGNFSCRAYGNFTIERIGYGGSLNVYAEYHNCYLPTMSPTPTPIPTPTPNFSCYGSGNVSTIEGYGDFNLIFSHYPNCTGYGYSSSYGNNSYYYHSSFGNFNCRAYGNFTIERIGYGGSLNVYAEYHNCYLPTMSPTPIPTPTPNFSCYGNGNDSTIEGYGDFNLIFSHYPNCTGNGYSSSYGNNSYYYHSSYGNFSCIAYGNFTIERIGYGGSLNVYAEYHNCYLPTMSPTPIPTPTPNFSCYGNGNDSTIEGYGDFNLIFSHYPNCTGNGYSSSYGNTSYYYHSSYGNFSCIAYGNFTIERIGYGGSLNVYAEYHNCYLPTMSPTPIPTPTPNFSCYGSGNVSTIEGYGDFNLIFSHYPNCTGYGYSSSYGNNSYYYRSSYGNFSCRAYGNFTIERIGYGGSLNVYAEYHNCYLPTMSPTPIPTPTPNFSCYGSGNDSTIEGYGDFNLIFSHYPNCTGNGYSSSYGNNSYFYHSSYGNFSCRAYGNFRIERIGYGGYLNVYADYHDCNLPTMSPTPTPTPISRFSCYGGSNRTIIVSGYGYFNLSFTQPANCTGDLFTHNSTYQTFETYGTFYCSASGFSEFSIERLQDGGFLNVSADYHNCFLPTISPSSTFSTPTPTPIPNFSCYGSGNVSTIEGYGDFNLIFSHYPNCTGNGYSSFYNNNRYYYRSYGNFSCRAYGNFTIERTGYGGSLNVYAEYHNCYLPTMSPTPIPTPTPNFSCYGNGNDSTIEGYGDFNLIFSHYPNCTGNGYSSSYGNNSYYYHSSYGNFSCRAYGNFRIERIGYGGYLNIYADYHDCNLPTMSPTPTPTPISRFSCYGGSNRTIIVSGYGYFNLSFTQPANCTGDLFTHNSTYQTFETYGTFYCSASGFSEFSIERLQDGGFLNVSADYHNCFLPTISPSSTFSTPTPTPIPNFICYGSGNVSTIEGYGDFNLIFSHYPNCTGNGYSSYYNNNRYYYRSYGNFSCRAYGNFTIERIGYGGSLNVYAEYHNCYLPTMSPTPIPTPTPNFSCYGSGNVSTIEGYGDFNLIFSHYPNCTGYGYSSSYGNNSYYYHSSYGNFSCRAYGNFTIERIGYGGSLNVYAEYHNCYLPTMSPTPIPTPTPNFSCYGNGNDSTIEGYGDFNLIFSHYPNCTGNGYSSSYGNNSYYYHSSYGNFSCIAYGNFTIERIGYGGSLNVYAEYHNCYLPTMSPTPTPIPTPTPNFSCYGSGNVSTIEGYGDFNLIFSHYPNCTGYGYSSSYGNNSYYYHSSFGNFNCRAYGNFTIERIGYGGSLNVYAEYHNCYLPTMSPTPIPTPTPNFSCYGNGNDSTIEGYGDFNLIFSHYPNCTGNGYSSSYGNNSYYYHSSYGNFSCIAYGNFTIERIGYGGSLNVYAEYHNCYLPTMSPTPIPTPTPNFSCYGNGNDSTIEGYGDFNLIFSHYPNCTGNGYSSSYGNTSYYYHSSYGNFSCIAYGNFTIERIGYGGSLNVYAEYHNCYLPTMSPTPIPTPTPNFSCYGSGNVSTIEGYGDFNLIFSHYPNCTGYGYSSSYGNNSYYYRSSYGNFSCRAYGNFTIERIGYGGSLNVYAEYHNCYLPTMSPTPIPTPTPNFSCYGSGNDSTIEGYGDFNLIFSHYPNCTGNGYSSSYGNNSYFYHSSYGNFSCRAYGNFRIERIGYGGYLNVYADYHDCNLPTMSPTPTPTPISRFSCYGGSNRTIIVSGYGYFNLSFTQPANCTGDLFTHNSTYQTFETYGTFYCSASGFSEFSIERLQDGGFLNVSADYHNCFLPTISPSSTFSTPTPTPIPNFSCYGSGNVSTIEGYGDFNLIFSHYPNCTGNGYSSFYNNNRYYYRSYGNFSCRAYGNFTIERTGYGGSLNVYAEYHNCYLPTMSPTPIPTPTPNFSCYGNGNDSTIEGYGDFNLIFSHYPNCTGNGYSSSYGNNSYYYHSSYGNFSCRAYGNFRIERIGYGGYLNVYADYHDCNLPTMSPTPTPTPISRFSCYGGSNRTIIVSGYGYFNLSFTQPANCTGDLFTHNSTYQTFETYGTFYCSASGFSEFSIERLQDGGFLNVSADYHNCFLPTISPSSTFSTPTPTPIPNFSCYGSGNVSTIEGYGDFNLIFSHYPNCTGNGYSSYYNNNRYYYRSYGNFSCRAYGNFTIERIGYGGSLNVYAEYHNCYLPTMSPTPIPTPTPNFSCYGSGNDSTIEGYGDFNLIFSHYPNCTGNGYSSSYGNNTYYYHSSYGSFSCRAYGSFRIERIGYGGSLNVAADYHNCVFPTIPPTPTPTPTSQFSCYGGSNRTIIVSGYGYFNLSFTQPANCTGAQFTHNSTYQTFETYGTFYCSVSGFSEFSIVRLQDGGVLNVSADYHNCFLPTISPTPVPGFTCYGGGNNISILGSGYFKLIFADHGSCFGAITSLSDDIFETNGSFFCDGFGNFTVERIQPGGVLNVDADFHNCFFTDYEISCFASDQYEIVGNGLISIIPQSSRPFDCAVGEMLFNNSDSNVNLLLGDFICSGNGFVQIIGLGQVFVNSTGYTNCTGTNVVVDDTPVFCSGFGVYRLSGVANATIVSLDELTCSGQVALLPFDEDQNNQTGELYYAGGYYSCNGTGYFIINGTGYANIDVTNGSHTCTGPQPILCATFNIAENGGISVVGDGEFTIIGDDNLYCDGNAVLCPGEINYYFTDGHFYCTGDLFAHIDGVGSIEYITGNNNCSGFGFAVPPPIFSGTPLTPQPVCIGYSNQYYLDGEGTFNISRIIGTISCNLDLQEVNSDVLTYSSYAQPFNCSGAGIFFLEGIGASTIVNNDGFFNCIDLTPLEQLICVGNSDSAFVVGIGSFVVTASLNSSCNPMFSVIDNGNESDTFAVSGSFSCYFEGPFRLDGNGTILDSRSIIFGGNLTCNNSSMGNFSVITSPTATLNTITTMPVISSSAILTSLPPVVSTIIVTSSIPVVSTATSSSSSPEVPTFTIVTSSTPVESISTVILSSSPEISTSPILSSSIPVVSASTIVTSLIPVESTSTAVQSSTPEVSTSAMLTSSIPVMSTSMVTSSIPVVLTSTIVQSSSPEVSTSAILTSSIPVMSTSIVTISIPVELTSTIVQSSTPEVSTSTIFTSSIPVMSTSIVTSSIPMVLNSTIVQSSTPEVSTSAILTSSIPVMSTSIVTSSIPWY